VLPKRREPLNIVNVYIGACTAVRRIWCCGAAWCRRGGRRRRVWCCRSRRVLLWWFCVGPAAGVSLHEETCVDG
jgi:hypothetical protein